MKIAVTGTTGQVVTSLVERAARQPFEIVALGRPQLDLCDSDTVAAAIAAARPDIVISAAAYTAVDQAEDEPDLAFAINERGAGAVARAARREGCPVIHLSTDYVFSGDQGTPHDEMAPTGPRSVYGQSKLAGEIAVREANPDHLIIRTAWVYSPFGRNFVTTMLRLAASRDQLSVVDDQYGNPTSALDIADGLLHVIAHRVANGGAPGQRGVYHFAGTGETSWCGFAREIFSVSRELGGPSADVVPIGTDQYPVKATRPKNSRLDCDRFARDFGHRAPDWRSSTRTVVTRLTANANTADL